MAKKQSQFSMTKALITQMFLSGTPLDNASVRMVTTPEEVRGEGTMYIRLHKWLWPKEAFIGDLFDFFSRVAFANEASEWIEFGRANGAPFARIKFHNAREAESLFFNLLDQSGLRAVVEEEGPEGLYLFVFEE